ncbi:WD domain, G-beta repeat [Novymonas esmeraldas]|uniref:WD domain, G-beta repeat n=1 Tax=Novymonas esmeraldas TaxID=1808958 RepID=A0AAW0EYG3_9TRYP
MDAIATEVVCAHAAGAQIRLRAVLDRLQTQRTAVDEHDGVQRISGDAVVATHAGSHTTVEASSPPPLRSCSPTYTRGAAPCAGAVELAAPRPLLEWPLAPLQERAKLKQARDAARQRRRAARQAAAAAAATAVPTVTTAAMAADMMRSALAQPLGAMAARLLGERAPVPSATSASLPLHGCASNDAALHTPSPPPPTPPSPGASPGRLRSSYTTPPRRDDAGLPHHRRRSRHDKDSRGRGSCACEVGAVAAQAGGGVFGRSPMQLLARTLRDAGAAALAASPLTRGGSRPSPSFADGSRRPSSSGGSISTSARSGPHVESGGGGSASSKAHRRRVSRTRAAHRSSPSSSTTTTSVSRPLTPLTIPRRGGRYDPHAPLLPLARCYADTPTRAVFSRVPSTSPRQSTASRSSTPVSSEWSVRSSSAGAVSDTAGREQQRGSARERRRSTAQSPTTNTQLSYVAEMDAIERGDVAPYVSYLFSPEARVVDLRELEGCVRHREPAAPLQATCIAFARTADVYLVGTSSGVLWRVPVGGGAEAVRATPLGSLWPPPTSVGAPATGGGISVKGDGGGGGGGAGNTSAASLLPVPLLGHTAAILSIAVNDDGALFATTGMDGCVIVWNALTSAKLRRIGAAWAGAAAAQRAPHTARFMPQNNNYLLVSHIGSSELQLFNSSTGLPVTSVAVVGSTSATASTAKDHRGTSAASHSGAGSRAAPARAASSAAAITALAVDPVASPFFFSGDASGAVVLWTYRAGDVAVWPTLRATASSSGSGGGGGGRHARNRSCVVDPAHHRSGVAATPLHRLPELRRLTALALPPQQGGVASISVSALTTAQLHHLLHRRGAHCPDTSDAAHHPLEPTGPLLRAVARQNRACWAAMEEPLMSDAPVVGTARGVMDSQHRRSGGGGPLSSAASTTAAGSSSSSSLPHALTELPSRLSESFLALWGGGGGGASSPAPEMRAVSAAAGVADGRHGPAALSERELLRQLRDDALDAVCPLLLLVSQPCDTVYALGLVLQLQPGARRGGAGHAAGGTTAAAGVGATTVNYRLHALLKATGPSRLRHLGVGAVQSPDNLRLIVVATPCEEGFVRVAPLLHAAPASSSAPHTSRTGPSPCGESGDGGRGRGHVLATLPMPFGGRCTGVAWSPNGRFLVAITAEGVVYQWARVYLLGPTAAAAADPAAASTAAASRAAAAAAGDAVASPQTHGAAHADAAAIAGSPHLPATRRRGCDTERSDAGHCFPSPAGALTGLLTPSLPRTAAAPTGHVVGASAAARAAFCAEDAWRESLQRELERQRRAQAALKLVAHAGGGGTAEDEGEENVSSSGYWLDDDAMTSARMQDSLDEEETESSL